MDSDISQRSNCNARPRDDAGNLVPAIPAMVALVEHGQHGPVGVHCTYLLPNGTDKADVPKHQHRASFGRVGGGAVRFGMPQVGLPLGVTEGIETALSIGIACGIPVWSALSAGGIRKLLLPPEAEHVHIGADNDSTGTGRRAAQSAADRFLTEGRRVLVAMPPDPGTDFNDLLRNRSAISVREEACYVA